MKDRRRTRSAERLQKLYVQYARTLVKSSTHCGFDKPLTAPSPFPQHNATRLLRSAVWARYLAVSHPRSPCYSDIISSRSLNVVLDGNRTSVVKRSVWTCG